MPAKAKGTTFVARGARYASVMVAPRKRLARTLAGIVDVGDEDGGKSWAGALQALVDALRDAGRSSEIEAKIDQALEVGRDDPAGGIERVHGAAGKLRAQRTAAKIVEPPRLSGGMSFKRFAERWTSGELHREYPDHVAEVAHDKNVSRLKTHVDPVLGPMALAGITLDHCQDVLRRISAEKSKDTRRHVAQLMVRIFNLATYPCRLLPHSPLPRGFLPKRGPRKARAYLYPDEDRKLLGCIDIPVAYRVLYGFLAREGMRSATEALALTWSDVDLVRGAINLDENKTDDPRSWALDPGVVQALKRWHELEGQPEPGEPVFTGISNPGHLAKRLRDEHLPLAKIDRAELFANTSARKNLTAHDLRATFVTISLANGRTSDWVADRTGHKSTGQIANYKRQARKVEELGLGPLLPLDKAIPEMRKTKRKAA